MSDEPAGVSDDVRTTFFGVDVFAATDDRPPRPDLPILRNWSHTKSHAALLGVAVGLLIGFGVLWGEKAAVFGVAAYLTQYVFAERQKRNDNSTVEHGIGAHDVRKKPWYFAVAVVGTAAVIVAVTP